ncbi:hypothetical protein Lal_00020832 [Lupinus albus]|nr:hypothetical protein Lal_00020832 [Lupinus albus]
MEKINDILQEFHMKLSSLEAIFYNECNNSHQPTYLSNSHTKYGKIDDNPDSPQKPILQLIIGRTMIKDKLTPCPLFQINTIPVAVDGPAEHLVALGFHQDSFQDPSLPEMRDCKLALADEAFFACQQHSLAEGQFYLTHGHLACCLLQTKPETGVGNIHIQNCVHFCRCTSM